MLFETFYVSAGGIPYTNYPRASSNIARRCLQLQWNSTQCQQGCAPDCLFPFLVVNAVAVRLLVAVSPVAAGLKVMLVMQYWHLICTDCAAVPVHAACGASAASFRFPLPKALCHLKLQTAECAVQWKNLVENAIKKAANKKTEEN